MELSEAIKKTRDILSDIEGSDWDYISAQILTYNINALNEKLTGLLSQAKSSPYKVYTVPNS